MGFEVYFAPRHIKAPLRPRSGDELAEVVDLVRAEEDTLLTFALVLWTGNPGDGRLYAVGVNPGEDDAAMMFAHPMRGNIYSQGAVAEPPHPCSVENFPHLGYIEFGNCRQFPLDSKVPATDIKAALRQLYSDPTHPPEHLEWQEWEHDPPAAQLAAEPEKGCTEAPPF